MGARPGGIRAACSHCDYARQFSPDLGGRFYRCPRCRQGVIAVPRASAEEAERWRSSEDDWLRASRARQDAAGRAPAAQASATEVDPGAPLRRPSPGKGVARAQPDAERDGRPGSDGRGRPAPPRPATAEPASGSAASGSAASGSAASGAAASGAEADPSETPRLLGGPARTPDEAAAPPNNKGEVATVRKILVECGLCSFMVGIPPAFFGKTIHCPSCAGDTVFSESTLEPVKDELFDRLALETHERAVLFRPPGEARWATARSFLIGVGLGLVAIAALWGVARARTASSRRAAVEAAVAEGWRYGSNGEEALLHEPWCRELTRPGQRLTEDQAARSGRPLHVCF